MTTGLRLLGTVGLLAGLATGAAGCSSGGGGADKFVGTWTYAGAITPNCTGVDVAPIDLTGDMVTITAPDASHLSVALGTYCTVTFNANGTTASITSNQTCTFPIPGFGMQTVMITSWTLTIAGDNSLTSNFMGMALICTPSGTGTLTRQSDAGG